MDARRSSWWWIGCLLIAACGGGGGAELPARMDIQYPEDAGDPGMGIPDPGRDPGQDLWEASPPGDLPTPECTPATVRTDCQQTCRDLGPCQQCICDLNDQGGTCKVISRPDQSACDDGDPCTDPDRCQDGACVPGEALCQCSRDDDCRLFDDEDLCNGRMVCDRRRFPFTCVLDPASVVQCSSAEDTACRVNRCDPALGLCQMTSVPEGESCLLPDPCVTRAECLQGECTARERRDCEDGNLCTTDGCDPGLGCTHVDNEEVCEDGDPCTVEDRCSRGTCRSGRPAPCDDGDPCNGIESCDRSEGCVPGTPLDCNDRNACTSDSCDPAAGGCVHEWLPDASEGPADDPRCLNGVDDDCDGLKDFLDPDCRFGLSAVDPADGPEVGGFTTTWTGQTLDQVVGARVDGTPVPFVVKSSMSLQVTMPPHDPGLVDVSIESAKFVFTLRGAFRYVSRVEDPSVIGALTSPTAPVVIREGESTPPLEATVRIPGITDGPSPDPSAVIGRFGYGPRGSLPWASTGWRWFGPAAGTPTGDGALRFSSYTVPQTGGYFDLAVRFSLDGGQSWIYRDTVPTRGTYDPAGALPFTVMGVPRAGAVVINEVCWMGSSDDITDEWIELRNMTPAPFEIAGWKITGIRYPSGDLVLGGEGQVVRSTVLEPEGYFLVSQYEAGRSALAVPPDIAVVPGTSPLRGMSIPNSPPKTWQLVTPGGLVVDQARFTGTAGVDGNPLLLQPERTMERRATPGTGLLDGDWMSARVADGFDGDPRQAMNLGTPRGPNSDIPLCATDADCAGRWPWETLTACEVRACDPALGRCRIAAIPDGGACDDGLFCTVGETCRSGECGNSLPRDCRDAGPVSACTLDLCDEEADLCRNPWNPEAVEGPAGDPRCSNGVDDDCDGFSDGQDLQCRFVVTRVSPGVVPNTGGWSLALVGDALNTVRKVRMGEVDCLWRLVNDQRIDFDSPSLPGVGFVTVSAWDGVVEARLTQAVRVIGLASGVLAGIDRPTSDLVVALGASTPPIHGRVQAAGVTSGPNPADPATLIAEIGIGPKGFLETDPFRDPGWTWWPAAYNPDCQDCPRLGVYEYRASIVPSARGNYLVAFRVSVDGGDRFQYGMLGEPRDAPWDPYQTIIVSVQ